MPFPFFPYFICRLIACFPFLCLLFLLPRKQLSNTFCHYYHTKNCSYRKLESCIFNQIRVFPYKHQHCHRKSASAIIASPGQLCCHKKCKHNPCPDSRYSHPGHFHITEQKYNRCRTGTKRISFFSKKSIVEQSNAGNMHSTDYQHMAGSCLLKDC